MDEVGNCLEWRGEGEAQVAATTTVREQILGEGQKTVVAQAKVGEDEEGWT